MRCWFTFPLEGPRDFAFFDRARIMDFKMNSVRYHCIYPIIWIDKYSMKLSLQRLTVDMTPENMEWLKVLLNGCSIDKLSLIFIPSTMDQMWATVTPCLINECWVTIICFYEGSLHAILSDAKCRNSPLLLTLSMSNSCWNLVPEDLWFQSKKFPDENVWKLIGIIIIRSWKVCLSLRFYYRLNIMITHLAGSLATELAASGVKEVSFDIHSSPCVVNYSVLFEIRVSSFRVLSRHSGRLPVFRTQVFSLL